jgi:hypothetical protein
VDGKLRGEMKTEKELTDKLVEEILTALGLPTHNSDGWRSSEWRKIAGIAGEAMHNAVILGVKQALAP